MSRIYANNRQVVVLAKYMISINQFDAKQFLEPTGYKAKLNGVEYNFDYKLVQLAIYIYRMLELESKSAARIKAKLPKPTE